MKRVLLMFFIGVLTAVLLIGCGASNSGGGSKAQLKIEDNGKTLEYKVGDAFETLLVSNPGTGFDWEWVKTDPLLVKQVGEVEWVTQGAGTGGGGMTKHTFQVTAKGEMKLKLIYHRAWEQGVEPESVFEVTLVVK